MFRGESKHYNHMFGMISPSSRTTVIDVTGGLSEVVKCLAARSTRASGCIGSDRDQSPVMLEVKQTAGLGLAPDHSDASHSRLRCIHTGLRYKQNCFIGPCSSIAGLTHLTFTSVTVPCPNIKEVNYRHTSTFIFFNIVPSCIYTLSPAVMDPFL